MVLAHPETIKMKVINIIIMKYYCPVEKIVVHYSNSQQLLRLLFYSSTPVNAPRRGRVPCWQLPMELGPGGRPMGCS